MVMLAYIAAVLFILAFLTKRRFGVLGLALCAGALLSDTLARSLAPLLSKQNIVLPPLSDVALAAIILTLLPSALLLLGGPKYLSKRAQLIGAAGYGLFGTLLLLGPLSSALILNSASRDILQNVANYESGLIAVGVAVAVLDMWSVHRPKLGRAAKKHH